MSSPAQPVQEIFGRLVTADGNVESARIVIDGDGIIESIEPIPFIESQEKAHDSSILAPAFFDVHIHGAAGHDVMEATPEALDAIGGFLATRGVGHFLATTVTAPLDRTLHALEDLATCIEAAAVHVARGERPAARVAIPMGIHLEGPFLSHGKRGVHPATELKEPSIELFEQIWQAARGHIRLMTIAPELPGALELIRYASGLGVRISLGHSDATAPQTRAGIVAGASSATHTFNAMRRLDQRDPGIAIVVLDSEDLYAELICDGVHVAPEFVRLWWRAKGAERALLVTDGISATGMPEGEYALGSLRVAVENGRCLLVDDRGRGAETLAGSVLTMDRAVVHLCRFTGCAVEEAVLAATRNPSRMSGLDDLASVAPGRPANLVRLSREGELLETILGAKRTQAPQEKSER